MEMQPLLDFLKEVDLLKSVHRQSLIHSGERRENSAEHSWHLAIAVLVCQGFSKEKLDLEKALKMALLHDVIEIDAGDTFVYDEGTSKKEKELAALERIFGILPAALAADLKTIWLEFEDRESPEAKYVAALDRFLPMYSNYLNGGYSWVNHSISTAQVHAKNQKPILEGLPALWDTAKRMIEESKARGYLR